MRQALEPNAASRSDAAVVSRGRPAGDSMGMMLAAIVVEAGLALLEAVKANVSRLR
jgi:hypothetical protein